MSIRVDSSTLITGSVVVGAPGLGVLAELVPSTGEHGAGYLYPSLELPADAGKEVRGLITTWPTLGTLTAFEDSSFEYDGASDTFAFQMYVDGQPVGTPQTVTIAVGVQVSLSSLTTSNVTQTGARHSLTISNAAAGTLYLAVYPSAAPVPTWNRTTGWSGTPVYTDADASPESSGSYTFVPDSSGLTASTPYVWYAVWDDGTDTVGPVASGGFSTLSAGVTAEGALAALSLTQLEASTAQAVSANGALAAVSLSSPEAVTSQFVSASGAIQALSLAAPTGSADSASTVSASGSLAALSLTAPESTPSVAVTQSGELGAISITSPSGTATTGSEVVASGNLVALTLSAPSGSSGVDIAGQGVMAGVLITSPGAVVGEVSIPTKTLTARVSALSFGARVQASVLSARVS